MDLTLKIIGNTQEKQPQFTFSEQGGSIGRSNDCSLCINGTFVSRKHAIIEFKENQYYLIDKSTNGIELNNAKSIIRKNIPYRVNDKDVFKIGEFAIIAELNHKESSQKSDYEPSPDPYAIIEDSPRYVPPKVDRSADIHDPIKVPRASTEALSTEDNLTVSEIPVDLNNIFQVGNPSEGSTQNTTNNIPNDLSNIFQVASPGTEADENTKNDTLSDTFQVDNLRQSRNEPPLNTFTQSESSINKDDLETFSIQGKTTTRLENETHTAPEDVLVHNPVDESHSEVTPPLKRPLPART